MKMVCISEDDEVRDFAKKAAMFFAKRKECHTYTDVGIEAGELFALRFGACDDCVVVFRIDEDFEPVNYQQLVRRYMED